MIIWLFAIISRMRKYFLYATLFIITVSSPLKAETLLLKLIHISINAKVICYAKYYLKSMNSCFKTETVNLHQMYFGEIYLRHQCYECSKMALITLTWRKPLTASSTHHHGSWCEPPSSWWRWMPWSLSWSQCPASSDAAVIGASLIYS